MKHLIQFTTVLFLLVQTIGFSQTTTTETSSKKQDSILKKQIELPEINTKTSQNFIGNYFLEEADFALEIVMENGLMYIISPFSKDILIQKNETTLHEPTRGVDLELIASNKDALKYTQNGYETIIKRVNSKTNN